MTNAERQKRYRDKQRGGPPRGRWAGRPSMAKIAKAQGIGRTIVFMCSWLMEHAPDLEQKIAAGELKVSPTYRQLRAQYVMAAARAVKERPDDPDVRLVESRKGGRFVFRWVKKK